MDAIGNAEELVKIRDDGRVSQFREVTDVHLHVSRDAEVMVHDHHAGTRFFAIGIRDVSGDTVFLWRQVSINDFHVGNPPFSPLNDPVITIEIKTQPKPRLFAYSFSL